MQTVLVELRPFLEILAMGTLSGWVTCLAFGVGLCAPDRAAAMGIPGILLGGMLFDTPVWPPPPWDSVYPLLPSLAGTAVVLFAAELYRRIAEETAERRRLEAIDERRRLRGSLRELHFPR